jgi:hypothetical protein
LLSCLVILALVIANGGTAKFAEAQNVEVAAAGAPEVPEDDDDEDDDDDDEDRLEIHLRHLEIDRAKLELNVGRFDLADRRAETASSQVRTAALVLNHLDRFVENQGQAVALLTDLIKEVKSPEVKRLLRMKLAEILLHADQQEKARQQLRALILEK